MIILIFLLVAQHLLLSFDLPLLMQAGLERPLAVLTGVGGRPPAYLTASLSLGQCNGTAGALSRE